MMAGRLRSRGIRPVLTLCLAIVVPALVAHTAVAEGLLRSYVWEYGGRIWTLSYTFSSSTYTLLRSLPHNDPYTLYGKYVDDSHDDAAISSLIGQIDRMATSAGLNMWDKLNLVISFVQSLSYASEDAEYPRYPLETLVEGHGDCEDFAILTAALLQEMGFGVVLLAYIQEEHMAVGVRVLPPDRKNATMYEWNGDTYYYVETTSPGWQIGQLPPEYASPPQIIATQETVSLRP